MKRTYNILKIIGIVVIIIAFLNPNFDYNRLVEVLLGIIIFLVGLINQKKRSKSQIFLFFILTMFFLYGVDTFVALCFSKRPVFALEIESSSQFKTYNGLGYRIFECDHKLTKDFFYQKSNICSIENLEEKDINALASEIYHNFDDYKNKFYILNGKVSYKEGNNKINLKSYNKEDDAINGNVTFNENIVFDFVFKDKKNIDHLKVYDNVKIVGRIAGLKKQKESYIITVKDAYIPDVDLYKNYTINIVEDKKCEKDKTKYEEGQEYIYYTSCLQKIYVVYENNDVYELDYVLKDNKITLDKLLKDAVLKNTDANENTLYEFENYNILVCQNNKDIIIGNKKLELDNNYCTVNNNKQDEL